MGQTKAQLQAVKRYQEKQELIRVWVSPSAKETAKLHAEDRGETLSSFVRRAITETIERDNSTED